MLKTEHKIFCSDARDMNHLDDQSIDLVITSPPYPMVEMWDEQFGSTDSRVKDYLEAADCHRAFETMHGVLDQVWKELHRVMRDGAFACINIGDAVRTLNKRFQLYPNHARVLNKFTELGFDALPLILWRKQTNAPNKFMGSGMLPAGAYVTLEHEYILIFRKGTKREFKTRTQKKSRMESSYFWEERNTWFSDLWDFKGIKQNTKNDSLRKRSAAYPFILPFRLINMYSLSGDTVLDPFIGTGTTTLAALAAGRNSVGYELDSSLLQLLSENLEQDISFLRKANCDRIKNHLEFINRCEEGNKELKHRNSFFGFPVMTLQEKDMKLSFIEKVAEIEKGIFQASYYDDAYIKCIGPENLTADSFDPERFIQNALSFDSE